MTTYLDRAKELFSRIEIPEGDEDAAFVGGLTAAIVAMAEALTDKGIEEPRMSIHETTVRTLWSQYAYGQMSEDELKTRLALINEHLGDNVSKGGFGLQRAEAPNFDLGPVENPEVAQKPVCGIDTPNGPCILERDHLTGESLPGDNGHLSQEMIDNIRVIHPKEKIETPPGKLSLITGTPSDGSVYKGEPTVGGQPWNRPAEDANDNPPQVANTPC